MRTTSLLLLLMACAHAPQLIPAPDAPRDPTIPNAAAVSVAGVDVSVGGKRWSGVPADLESVVTPLYVRVHNGANAPVRIRYHDLSITAQSGLQTAAIPPFQIQRPGQQVVALAPAFTSDRFFLYDRYRHFYPGLPLWEGPWDFDPAFYDQYYSWQPSLPSRDMLQQALPEGVLQPGGSAAGFLYFHQLQEKGPVTFSAEIIGATTTREPMGTARIPLVLQ